MPAAAGGRQHRRGPSRKLAAAQEENEEFGRQLDEGKMHAIETELAMQKAYCEELNQDVDGENRASVCAC